MPIRPNDFDLIVLLPPSAPPPEPDQPFTPAPVPTPPRPTSTTSPVLVPPSTSVRPLFSMRAITLSTLIGSPIAGSVLLAANFRKLGIKGAAWSVVCLGVLLFVTETLLLFSSRGRGGAGAFLLVFLSMWLIAKISQGHALRSHVALGGKLISGWLGFGIGLLCFAVFTVPVVLFYRGF